jgi:hypothetical protein
VRLYSARSDTGVGRNGPAETFIEINLSLLGPDAAGYLPLLFGARALADDGTITEILRQSADFATELGSRLRERLYDAVPGLAMAVAQHQDVTGALGAGDLRRAYEQTLTLLSGCCSWRTARTGIYRRTEATPSTPSMHSRPAPGRWPSSGRRGSPPASTPSGTTSAQYFRRSITDAPIGACRPRLAGLRLTDAEIGPALLALLVDAGPDGVVLASDHGADRGDRGRGSGAGRRDAPGR